MLGFNQPMSSPMIIRMLGFFVAGAWAMAIPGISTTRAAQNQKHLPFMRPPLIEPAQAPTQGMRAT